MTDDSSSKVTSDIDQVLRIVAGMSHPARLRILLALAPGESDTGHLPNMLRDLDPTKVLAQLLELYHKGLAKRRKLGPHTAYSLTRDGAAAVHAYQAILSALGMPATALLDQMASSRSAATNPTPTRRETLPSGASAELIAAATMLNHAGNPLRLRLLLALAEGGRDSHQLATELGDASTSKVSQYLTTLIEGSLVATRRGGKQKIYSLTVNGLSLVQIALATCSGLSVRRGELVLRPDPILTEQGDALDPTSPDGLACLLRAFADPLRLRLLNLMVGAGEVCTCHLPEALQVPRDQIMWTVVLLRKTGVVLERSAGEYVSQLPWTGGYPKSPEAQLALIKQPRRTGGQSDNTNVF